MPPIARSNENKLQKIGILFVACRYFLRIDEFRDADDTLHVVCKSFVCALEIPLKTNQEAGADCSEGVGADLRRCALVS